MPILFTPGKFANAKVKNRFVHSATYEAMATPSGDVTNKLSLISIINLKQSIHFQ